MIGMSQIKKKMMQGLFIGIGIGVVGIGLTVWLSIRTIKTYENGTNKKYNSKYTQDVVVCKRNIIQGEVITADMVTVAKNINKQTIPTGAKSSVASVVGSVAKYNIAANVPVLEPMLTTEIVAADVRSQEINTVLMPSDLNIGDYVDIRLMLPNGTDYVVLAQKKVENIVDSTFWMNLAEDERLLLNSATVDSYLNQGSKLYATKYTDATSQTNLTESALTTAKGYVKEEIKKQADDLQKGLDELKQSDTSTNTDTSANTDTNTSANTCANTNANTTESTGTDKFTDSLFDLIVKYKNFASAATRINENYQPNTQVMYLMKNNQNILKDATTKLSEEARRNIESSLSNYKSENEKEYNNVVSGAQQSITAQQTQRTALLNGSSTTSANQ